MTTTVVTAVKYRLITVSHKNKNRRKNGCVCLYKDVHMSNCFVSGKHTGNTLSQVHGLIKQAQWQSIKIEPLYLGW